MTYLEQVETSAAPTPLGGYAQATVTPDGMVWVSAQLPIGVTADADAAAQARQALSNVLKIVQASDGDVHSVAKVTLYLTDISDWDPVDNVFAALFGEHRPARAVLGIKHLHHGFRVAADAVAWRVRRESR